MQRPEYGIWCDDSEEVVESGHKTWEKAEAAYVRLVTKRGKDPSFLRIIEISPSSEGGVVY